MVEYSKLKKSENGMPTWDSFIPIVLDIIHQQKSWKGNELKRVAVKSIKNLPDEFISIKLNETDSTTVLENRAGWALSRLTIAGLISRPKRGIYSLNEFGKKTFLEKGYNLDYKFVESLPDYLAHLANLKERKKDESSSEIEFSGEGATALEKLSDLTKNLNAEIASELLERILEQDWTFFEKLVVELLVAMGYKGENGQAFVTKKSNDKGIDGVISQDALATSTIYLQAKRYKPGITVGRPEISGFYGDLKLHKSNKGVFLTTSRFAKGAVEAAKNFGIILIDGVKLTDLMLQYRIGVREKQKFEILDIDEDFFEE